MSTYQETKQTSTNMNTNINTIGWAIVFQTVIRYGAFLAMAWLFLTFADVWVTAYISKL